MKNENSRPRVRKAETDRLGRRLQNRRSNDKNDADQENEEEERDKNDNEEGESENELEILRRRAEWFQNYAASHPSALAISAKRSSFSESRRRETQRAPGPLTLKRGFALTPKANLSARISRNPRRKSALGICSDVIEVLGTFAGSAATLQLAILDEATESVDLASVRLFRYDEKLRDWFLIPRSGIVEGANAAWGIIARSGKYAAIGLPNDLRTRAILNIVAAFFPSTQSSFEKILPSVRKFLSQLPATDSYASSLLDQLKDHFESFFADLDFTPRGLPELALIGDIPEPEPWQPIPAWPWREPLIPKFKSRWVSHGPTKISVSPTQSQTPQTAGRVLALAVHPENSNVVYAGAANGGVWVTNDGGANWKALLQDGLSLAIGAIAISPNNPWILYAGTGEDYTPGTPSVFPGKGIYKTTDAGKTWSLTASIDSTAINAMAVDPVNPDIVYAAGNEGLHRSVDGGVSWTRVLYGQVTDVIIDPARSQRVFAGTYFGVQRSEDNGLTWNNVLSVEPGWTKLAACVLPVGKKPTILIGSRSYILAKTGYFSDDLYSSTDSGNTWSLVNQGNGVEGGFTFPHSPYADMLAVHPDDRNIIISGMIPKRLTHDGGKTWTLFGEDTWVDFHAAVFCPSDSDVLYIASDGGVFRCQRSPSGQFTTFEPRNTGLVITQFYGVAVSQAKPFLLGGTTQDLGCIVTTGQPDQWTRLPRLNEGGFLKIDPNNSAALFADTWFSWLSRSLDSGNTWTKIVDGLGSVDRALIQRGAQIEDQTSTFNASGFIQWVGPPGIPLSATVGDGLYIGVNHRFGDLRYIPTIAGQGGAITWEYLGGSQWKPLKFDEDNPGASTFSASADGRLSWFYPKYPSDWPPSEFHGETFQWLRARVSDDGGITWKSAAGVGSDSLPREPIDRIVIDSWNPDGLVVLTPIGIWRSQDRGNTWEDFNFGLPPIMVTDLTILKKSGMLYASTMGRGIFKRGVL